jgi:pimeloyl-ACP methyl ester carboxylesterase
MLVDPHGWGASEVAPPTFETFIDDVSTVMNAVGSERATVIGFSEGGPVAICSQPPIRSARRDSCC